MRRESTWCAMFHGLTIRMWKREERLSLPYVTDNAFVWVAVDATLDWIIGVSWSEKQFTGAGYRNAGSGSRIGLLNHFGLMNVIS